MEKFGQLLFENTPKGIAKLASLCIVNVLYHKASTALSRQYITYIEPHLETFFNWFATRANNKNAFGLATQGFGGEKMALSENEFLTGFSDTMKKGMCEEAGDKTHAPMALEKAVDQATGLVEKNKVANLIVEHTSNSKLAFSESELRAAKFMSEQGHNVVLRHPIGTRVDGKTSDLLVNNICYDVYTPTTSNPKSIISGIAKKNSQASGIVLDLSQTTVTSEQLGNVLARVRGAVQSGGKISNIIDIIILPKD